MNTLTDYEISQLPKPPKEWIEDIKMKEIKKSIETLEEYDWLDIYDILKTYMGMDIKNLKMQIKRNKSNCCYENYMGLKQSRNGKITKNGLVKNLIFNDYEMDCKDVGFVSNFLEKGIEYLVDNYVA